jgi:CubicO group peptidase (beta-lactamase class C family)
VPDDRPAAQLANNIRFLLTDAVRKGVFAGAAAAVAWGIPEDRQEVVITAGTIAGSGSSSVSPRTCFDLASLTKPFATTLAVLCLINEGKVALDLPLPSLLPDDIPADKQRITLRHLLGHASGLPSHRPYYKELVKMPPEGRNAALRRWLLAEPLLYIPGCGCLYSDLDYMLLGIIVEEKSGRQLDSVIATTVLAPLLLEEELFFHPLGAASPKRPFAATEDCPWRGRILSGEVHDDNAHAMGGVAGHAGLFGTAGGVLALALHLLDVRQGRTAHPAYRPKDLQAFLASRHENTKTSWLLGFDTPSPVGSSTGHYFSESSFGHLGFTGTSFWVDPEKELAVALLTNRVYPSRDNNRIKAFRPHFHDTVAETLF